MRSKIDQMVTLATLQAMQALLPQLLDAALDEAPSDIQEKLTKNVCTKVSIQLSARLDKLVHDLYLSKREFVEAAIIEALDKAEAIIDAEGLNEHLAEIQHRNEVSAS